MTITLKQARLIKEKRQKDFRPFIGRCAFKLIVN